MERCEADRMDAQGLAPEGFQLRPMRPADLGFLQRLYASTRAEEMARTSWPSHECEQFLAHQFGCQHRYYLDHYADAEFLLLERHGRPVGRLYWNGVGRNAQLIDISLLPEWRGRGYGSQCLQRLVDRADRMSFSDGCGQSIGLFVEPDNPAHRLYRRFGFEVVADNSVYLQMRREARAVAPSLVSDGSERQAPWPPLPNAGFRQRPSAGDGAAQ